MKRPERPLRGHRSPARAPRVRLPEIESAPVQTGVGAGVRDRRTDEPARRASRVEPVAPDPAQQSDDRRRPTDLGDRTDCRRR